MRKLIVVPMIHIIPPNEKGLDNDPRTFDYWSIIDSALNRLAVHRPRFYIDNYTGPTFEVTQNNLGELLPKDILDSGIIKTFMERVGGTVENTEDPKVVAELDTEIMQAVDGLSHLEEAGSEEAAIGALIGLLRRVDEVVERTGRIRDEHIAGRIEQTLQAGETGVLFIGAGHNVSSKLPDDIETQILDERLTEMHREIKDSANAKFERETGLGQRL